MSAISDISATEQHTVCTTQDERRGKDKVDFQQADHKSTRNEFDT
jgi:hypothetical protein